MFNVADHNHRIEIHYEVRAAPKNNPCYDPRRPYGLTTYLTTTTLGTFVAFEKVRPNHVAKVRYMPWEDDMIHILRLEERDDFLGWLRQYNKQQAKNAESTAAVEGPSITTVAEKSTLATDEEITTVNDHEQSQSLASKNGGESSTPPAPPLNLVSCTATEFSARLGIPRTPAPAVLVTRTPAPAVLVTPATPLTSETLKSHINTPIRRSVVTLSYDESEFDKLSARWAADDDDENGDEAADADGADDAHDTDDADHAEGPCDVSDTTADPAADIVDCDADDSDIESDSDSEAGVAPSGSGRFWRRSVPSIAPSVVASITTISVASFDSSEPLLSASSSCSSIASHLIVEAPLEDAREDLRFNDDALDALVGATFGDVDDADSHSNEAEQVEAPKVEVHESIRTPSPKALQEIQAVINSLEENVQSLSDSDAFEDLVGPPWDTVTESDSDSESDSANEEHSFEEGVVDPSEDEEPFSPEDFEAEEFQSQESQIDETSSDLHTSSGRNSAGDECDTKSPLSVSSAENATDVEEAKDHHSSTSSSGPPENGDASTSITAAAATAETPAMETGNPETSGPESPSANSSTLSAVSDLNTSDKSTTVEEQSDTLYTESDTNATPPSSALSPVGPAINTTLGNMLKFVDPKKPAMVENTMAGDAMITTTLLLDSTAPPPRLDELVLPKEDPVDDDMESWVMPNVTDSKLFASHEYDACGIDRWASYADYVVDYSPHFEYTSSLIRLGASRHSFAPDSVMWNGVRASDMADFGAPTFPCDSVVESSIPHADGTAKIETKIEIIKAEVFVNGPRQEQVQEFIVGDHIPECERSQSDQEGLCEQRPSSVEDTPLASGAHDEAEPVESEVPSLNLRSSFSEDSFLGNEEPKKTVNKPRRFRPRKNLAKIARALRSVLLMALS